MRQGQQNKRGRSRGRKGANPLTRTYESNGPDVKIRGTASHVADKYLSLSRDAQASGDRVMAENYLQHAEHYLRIIAAASPQREPQEQPRLDEQAMKNGFVQEGVEEAPAASNGAEDAEVQPVLANGHDGGHAADSSNGSADAGEGSEITSGGADGDRPRRRKPSRPRQRKTNVEAAEAPQAEAGDQNGSADDEAEEKPVRRRRAARAPKPAVEASSDGDAPSEAVVPPAAE